MTKVILLLFLCSLPTYAQMADNISTTSADKSALSAVVRTDFSSDFREEESVDKQRSLQTLVLLNYAVAPKDQVGLMLPLEKQLSQGYQEGFFLDSRLGYTRVGLLDNDYFRLNQRVALIYPTTENTKRKQDMLSGLEINPAFSLKSSILPEGVSIGYTPRYRRRFHKFTTDRSGTYLVNQSLMHFLSAGYSFTDNLSLSTLFLYVQSTRYDGTRVDDAYLTNFELSYKINSSIRVQAGVLTGGTVAEQELGPDQNVRVFDNNDSFYNLGATIVF